MSIALPPLEPLEPLLELPPALLLVLLLLLLLPQAASANTVPTSMQAIITLPSIRMLLLKSR
jgi:hypothetical protein